jgi:hypothetical protein
MATAISTFWSWEGRPPWARKFLPSRTSFALHAELFLGERDRSSKRDQRANHPATVRRARSSAAAVMAQTPIEVALR